MLEALVFLLVTLSTFLLVGVVASILRRAYRQYRERYVTQSLGDLSAMFLFLDARQLLSLSAAAMGLLGLLGYLVRGAPAALVGVIAGPFLPRLLVRLYRRRRLRRFDAQLVDALQALAGALRAGLTLAQGMEQVAKTAGPPLSQELGLCLKEMKLGVSFDEALNALGRRVGSEDLSLVITATQTARQLGANLAEMFETLSATTQERFRLEGRLEALTAQGRLQAWVMAAMPLALAAALEAVNPGYLGPMMRHAFGYCLVGVIVLMELLGVLLIRRMVHIDA